jgi:hypothetical protein
MVGNDAANRWDYLGLDMEASMWQEQRRRRIEAEQKEEAEQKSKKLKDKEFKEGNFSCCDEAKIAEGLKVLMQRVRNEHNKMQGEGIETKGEDDDNSCYVLNQRIFSAMDGVTGFFGETEFGKPVESRKVLGIPECWICWLENRHKWGFPMQMDHTVVVCESFSSDGKSGGRIIFDYW